MLKVGGRGDVKGKVLLLPHCHVSLSLCIVVAMYHCCCVSSSLCIIVTMCPHHVSSSPCVLAMSLCCVITIVIILCPHHIIVPGRPCPVSQ